MVYRTRRTWQVSALSFYMTILTLPFDSLGIETDFVVISVTKIFLLISVFSGVVATLGDAELRIQRSQLLLLLLMSLYVGYHVIRAVFGEGVIGLLRAKVHIGNLLIIVAAVLNISARSTIRRTIGAIIIGAILVTILTFLASAGVVPPLTEVAPSRTFFGFNLPVARTLGAPIGYGTYGSLISVPIAVSLLVALETQSFWQRAVAWFGTGLLVLGGIVSQSRSTYLALMTVGVVVVSGRYFLGNFRMTWIDRTVLFGVGCVVAVGPIVVVELFAVAPWSVSTRLDLIESGIELVLQRPILGVGPVLHIEGKVIHNSFVNEFAATGLIGFGLFVAIWMLATRNAVRYIGDTSSIYSLGLIAGLAGVFVENLFYLGTYSPILWIILTLCVSVPISVVPAEPNEGPFPKRINRKSSGK